MEEEKKEGLENIEGQRRLPPRPMPPRPPLMKKQIVVEGEQEEKKVEVQSPAPKQEQVTTETKQEEPKQVDTFKQEEIKSVEKTEKPEEKSVVRSREKKSQKEISEERAKTAKRTHERATNKFNKKKFWLVTSAVVVGIGLVVGLVFLIISNLPAKPLATPQNLMISSNNETVYVTCDGVAGATKYIFEIDGKKYDSKTPSFDLSKLVEPKEYSIKVYATGDKNGSLSKASKTITYDLRKKLQAPIIHFYESGSSVLCWSEIEGATSYELFYNNQTKNLGNVLSFDLSVLGGGEYVVQVRAKTTKAGYIDSAYSNSLQHSVYERLQGIAGRVLPNGKIEITRVANASSYVITINEKTFGVAKFEEDKYIVELSVAGIAPNTTISYFKIEAVGENYFISNSAELDPTVSLE